METRERPDWILRVPVVRPRLAIWIDRGMTAAVAVAVAVSLFWQGFPAVLAAGASAGLYALRFWADSRRARASGLLLTHSGAVYLRMPEGWRPVALCQAWRGWRCLTLRGRLPAPVCNKRADRNGDVTLTLWQDALAPEAWRRTCLLIERRLRRVAPRRPVEAS